MCVDVLLTFLSYIFRIWMNNIGGTGKMHGFTRFQGPPGAQNFSPGFLQRGPSPNQHNFHMPPPQQSPRQQVSYLDINVFHNGTNRQQVNYGKNFGRHPRPNFKVALGVSPQFFSIWTRVLKHNKYVEIKQFSKVDIKQNNISTVILLIKFLVYQWDRPHLQGSRVVYIFVYIIKHFCVFQS